MNKNAIVITIGRISQMLIMFLTYRVLSMVLSVKDMGIYYFLLSIAGAFGLIFANPIGMYANRMMHSWKEHARLLLNLRTIIKSFLIGSLLTIPVLFIYKQKISLEENHWAFIVFTLVFYVFSTSINGTLVPSLNLLGFANHFVILTLLTNLVGLILSYLLVVLVAPHPLYWLVGQAISLTIFGAVAFIVLCRKNQEAEEIVKPPSHLRLKRVFKFALPIVVTNIAVWVLSQSFRFFYKENVDLTVLGELAFGLGLATSLCVAVEYLFQQLYMPDFYARINEPNSDKGAAWNSLFNKLLPVYIYFTVFIIGLSPFIMRVLADVKFKNSAYYLALGAFVEIVRMIGNIFNTATQSEMKTHKAIAPYLLGGLITITGVLFISAHPAYIRYTPFCLLAGYLVASIYLGINVGRLIKIEISFKSILKYVLSSLVFLSALFFARYSESLIYSILIGFVYGLLLLFYFYQSYAKRKMGC